MDTDTKYESGTLPNGDGFMSIAASGPVRDLIKLGDTVTAVSTNVADMSQELTMEGSDGATYVWRKPGILRGPKLTVKVWEHNGRDAIEVSGDLDTALKVFGAFMSTDQVSVKGIDLAKQGS
jgi:hypothetical protein